MTMKKILPILLFSLIFINAVFAEQEFTPVTTEQVLTEKGDSVFLTINFSVSPNWMVYDSIIGDGGPIPLTFDFSDLTNVSLIQIIKPVHLHKKHDEIFEVDMLYFKENSTYKFVFIKTEGQKPFSISGTFEYMCCNLTSGVCLAPRTEDIQFPK